MKQMELTNRSHSADSAAPSWTEAKWASCTEQELLIDLAEWADAAGCERLTSYRCALTSPLWTLLEAAPAPARARSAGLDRHLRSILRAADRILPGLPSDLAAPGAVVDFAVLLPSRSGAPSGRSLRLHAERATGGALFVSIGLRADFSVHPLERTAGDPPRDTPRGEPTHRSGISSARSESSRTWRRRPLEPTRSVAASWIGLFAGCV